MAIKRVKWNRDLGWRPVADVCSRRGFAVEIGFNPLQESEYRWCVHFAGSGQYFQTVGEAIDYCVSRKWCKEETAGVLIRKCCAAAEILTAGKGVCDER